MTRKSLFLVIGFLIALACAPTAKAQYRNMLFGIGAGPHMVVPMGDNLQFYPGVMIGGESLFKMRSDHWWFGVKFHGGVRMLKSEAGREAIGTMLSIRPSLFVRYVFMTDKFRPFVSFGGAFTTNIFFSDVAADVEADYLPHNKWGSLVVTPGIEYVFMRNVSIQIAVDTEWVMVWSGKDAIGIFPTISFMFYM